MQRELLHFYDILDGKFANDTTIEKAYQILRIAKGVRDCGF